MNLGKLLMAGVVFMLTKAATDAIVREMNLSGEAKEIVGWGTGVGVGKVVHALL